MIHVVRVSEPKPPDFDFDTEVRQPGLGLLAVLRGLKGAPRKRFPKRRKVKRVTPSMLSPYWRRALPSLGRCYGDVCAYSGLYLYKERGSGTVDHWQPKEIHPDKAYEWDNFRLASRTMNTRKGTDETLCDPFQVQDFWFLLDFITFSLSPAPNLPKAIEDMVVHTIDRLQLDREPMRKAREEAWKLYEHNPSPFNWWLMARDCPLVERQYLRQHKGVRPPASLPPWTPPP